MLQATAIKIEPDEGKDGVQDHLDAGQGPAALEGPEVAAPEPVLQSAALVVQEPEKPKTWVDAPAGQPAFNYQDTMADTMPASEDDHWDLAGLFDFPDPNEDAQVYDAPDLSPTTTTTLTSEEPSEWPQPPKPLEAKATSEPPAQQTQKAEHVATKPPPVLSDRAIDQKLRRIVAPRADGTYLVGSDWVDAFKDLSGGGRDKVKGLFEKCGYDRD